MPLPKCLWTMRWACCRGCRGGLTSMCVRARCVVARVLMLIQVRFDACDGFEFTQELCVFDMCKIGLFHCWVYDPHSEPDVAAAMGHRHYNEVRLILCGVRPGPDLWPGCACHVQLPWGGVAPRIPRCSCSIAAARHRAARGTA